MELRWKLLIVVALVVTVLDQWSKFLAVKHLTPGIAQAHLKATQQSPVHSASELQKITDNLGSFQSLKYFYTAVESPCDRRRGLCPRVKVVEGFWNWRYAENKGAAWSLFAKAGDAFRLPFLIGVSIAAVFFIINFIRKLEPEQKLLMWSLSLICGGAIGNLIDRVYLGYVIDFIDWYAGTYHWPTF